MPVYSLSRTDQFTTVSQIQTKSNQTSFYFNGYDQDGFASSFLANVGTSSNSICSSSNRLYNYTTASAPVANYTWYPYSMTLAICGGGAYYNEDGTGGVTYRPGLAYLKLYNSTGTFLMGSTNDSLTTPDITPPIPSSSLIVNGSGVGAGQTWTLQNAILSTTKVFNNSRNTLTITGSTKYHAGAANPLTATSFWAIYGKTTNETGQNTYLDTTVTMSGNMTLNLRDSNVSILGFIKYNNAPVQPTSVVFTTTTDGIEVTYRGNEVNSLVDSSTSTTLGAVSRTLFFYSETLTGTYDVLEFDTSITRTLVSGTTYEYTASLTGGTTLQKGKSYYFKIASGNDVCTKYAAENGTTYVAGSQSTPILAQYGIGGFVKVYKNTSTWDNAPIYVNTSLGWQLKSDVFAKNTSTGYIFN